MMSMRRKPNRPSRPFRRPGVPRQKRKSTLDSRGKARPRGPLIRVAIPARTKPKVSQTGPLSDPAAIQAQQAERDDRGEQQVHARIMGRACHEQATEADKPRGEGYPAVVARGPGQQPGRAREQHGGQGRAQKKEQGLVHAGNAVQQVQKPEIQRRLVRIGQTVEVPGPASAPSSRRMYTSAWRTSSENHRGRTTRSWDRVMRAVSSISTGSPARDSRRNRREAGPGSVSPAGGNAFGPGRFRTFAGPRARRARGGNFVRRRTIAGGKFPLRGGGRDFRSHKRAGSSAVGAAAAGETDSLSSGVGTAGSPAGGTATASGGRGGGVGAAGGSRRNGGDVGLRRSCGLL